MSFPAEVGRFGMRNRLRDIAADGDRHDPVLVAMPDVYPRIDVFKPEVPLGGEHANVLRDAAAAVVEGLEHVFVPEPLHACPPQHSWIRPARQAIRLSAPQP